MARLDGKYQKQNNNLSSRTISLVISRSLHLVGLHSECETEMLDLWSKRNHLSFSAQLLTSGVDALL